MHKLIKVFGAFILLATIGYVAYQYVYVKQPAGTTTEENETPILETTAEVTPIVGNEVVVVAENLSVPWEIVFMPTGEMLVTERDGRLVKIAGNKTVIDIEGVNETSEGGLLGLALHPNFIENAYLYIYKTTKKSGALVNVVERYKLVGDKLEERKEIFGGIPAAQIHDGGRIHFGPDAKLYVTTGDAGKSSSAQLNSYLGGKILRLNDDGTIPEDNPMSGSPVYTLGHRNSEGIAWDEDGVLWSVEHGRSGLASGYDEINKIAAGKNYGWPTVQGPQAKSGFVSPVAQSGSTTTWAPGDVAYFDKHLFFTGLRGEALYVYEIATKKLTRHFYKQYGRLRVVVIGEDGMLYMGTSNKDGRGSPKSGDDRIMKLDPRSLL